MMKQVCITKYLEIIFLTGKLSLVMKKITILILVIASAILLTAVCWYFYTPDPQKLPVSTMTHQYIYDISSKYETMGMSDYVFVENKEKMEEKLAEILKEVDF